jgi:hypothetical protein
MMLYSLAFLPVLIMVLIVIDPHPFLGGNAESCAHCARHIKE